MTYIGELICLALDGHKVYDMTREHMTTLNFQTECYNAEFDTVLCILTFSLEPNSPNRYMSVRPDLFADGNNVSRADHEALRALTDRIESYTERRQSILDEIPHLNKYST